MALDISDLNNFDFTQVGGTPLFGAQSEDGGPCINFGVAGQPGLEGPVVPVEDKPSFHAQAPHLGDRWDGKTTICVPDFERKVTGEPIPAQFQPNGTCGGRAGSGGNDGLSCVLIANGQNAKFKRASHAWLYYLARRDAGMLRGGDGVPDGSIHVAMAKYGLLSRDECGDEDADSKASDRLAVAWGGGRMSASDTKKYTELASDNLIKDWARCKSAQETADALASGGVIIVSGDRGYTMTRDSEGMCSKRGTWYHYFGINGAFVTPSGRKGFSYKQSWSETVPGGPLLLDGRFPGHCFGITWEEMETTCRTNTVIALFSFELWDKSAALEIDWKKFF